MRKNGFCTRISKCTNYFYTAPILDFRVHIPYQINDHLFEGRYTPTNAHGKREVHTVYAKTREEVEPLLERMIAEVRTQIKEEKRQLKESVAGSNPAAG